MEWAWQIPTREKGLASLGRMHVLGNSGGDDGTVGWGNIIKGLSIKAERLDLIWKDLVFEKC